MSGEALLVVDENLTRAKLMGVLLEAAGYQVHLAHDSEQALERVKAVGPALVLMDIQVPRQGGSALVRRLKADPKASKTLFLMITGAIQNGDEKKAVEAGCVGCLSKPVDIHRLGDIVTKLLRGYSFEETL